MITTNIQWCDSTVNPVMGCDGCELYPQPKLIASAIIENLVKANIPPRLAEEVVRSVCDGLDTTDLHQQRAAIGQKIESGLPKKFRQDIEAIVINTIREKVKCYAAVIHHNRGENTAKPENKPHPGYATRFERPTTFSGRMNDAADLSPLSGTERENKAWLNGLPRLIFVSDMGDALSKDISFDFLKREIVDVVTSPKGARHIWLWLTKRPVNMFRFARWLKDQGVDWPDNLVPMTTVTSSKTSYRVKHLKMIPAKAWGLSVEPLRESITLDLAGIDWCIVGGESGFKPAPFDLAWARDLQQQCQESGTAFFLKQLGGNPIVDGKKLLKLKDRHGGDWEQWPDDLRERNFPAAFTLLAAPKAKDLEAFQRLEEIIRKGNGAFIETGNAMGELREKELWTVGKHKSWEAYCRDAHGMSKTFANRLIKSAGLAVNLPSVTIGTGELIRPRSESQIRPLTSDKLSFAEQVAVWEHAVETAKGHPTAKQVNNALKKMVPSVGKASEQSVTGKRVDALRRFRKAVGNLLFPDEALEALHELAQLLGEKDGEQGCETESSPSTVNSCNAKDVSTGEPNVNEEAA